MGLSLGIDTSAYTSSAAVCSEDGKILFQKRKLLSVASGQRGLRQSDAFYQHWENLPDILSEILNSYRNRISVICVSSRPRPVEGSYMPVFNAGLKAAKLISSALDVPLYLTSHQEGHVLAAAYGSDIDLKKPLIFAHLSGGTLELVKISSGQFCIIGGTKDISYGQLIDRFGVLRGFPFPSGSYIDDLAVGYLPEHQKNPISRIFTDGTSICLSGTEDKLKSSILPDAELSYYLMERISQSLITIIDNACKEYNIRQVLIGGGVACSRFIRNYCKEKGYTFGLTELCNDNAAGVALTGGKNPWL